MVINYFILLKTIIALLGAANDVENPRSVDINIINIKEDRLDFEVVNLSKDTFYILDDWAVSLLPEMEHLQIRGRPRFGGMDTYQVDMIKLCPGDKTGFSISTNGSKCDYTTIVFVITPISQAQWEEEGYISIDCLSSTSISSVNALSLVATGELLIQYEKEFIKK